MVVAATCVKGDAGLLAEKCDVSYASEARARSIFPLERNAGVEGGAVGGRTVVALMVVSAE